MILSYPILVCANGYDCVEEKYQSGHEVQHTTEYSNSQCARRCCFYELCVGYYWNKQTFRCSLTKSTGLTVAAAAYTSWCAKKMGKHSLNLHLIKFLLQNQ